MTDINSPTRAKGPLADELHIKDVHLPNTYANRGLWARLAYVEYPKLSEVDDDGLLWMPYMDGYWYSIAGNYSASSPAEKRQKMVDREKEYQARLETAEEIYRRVMYQSHVRQAVLDRDGYECQLCGALATTKLHVHHVLKRTQGGTDHLDNLLTVCNKCHKRADTTLYDPDWVYVESTQ